MGLIVFTLGQRVQVWGTNSARPSNCSVLMGMEPIFDFGGGGDFPAREHIGYPGDGSDSCSA